MSRARVAVAVKRAVDVVGAATLLVVTAPVLALAALAVRVTMGSPVLFRQERIGQDERRFVVVKLRTMRAPAPGEGGPASDGARLTRLGRWLRACGVDELPQLCGVVRGDLSLVGPRPLLPAYLPRYSDEQRRRHEVPPGLTGLAQVYGRNAVTWGERLALDVWYVDHWSLALDARIALRTVDVLRRRVGASAEGHATMPEFRGTESAS